MADQPTPPTPADSDEEALRPKVTQRQIMMGVAAGVVSGLLIAAGSLFHNPPNLDPAPEAPSEELTDALDSIDRALLDAGVAPATPIEVDAPDPEAIPEESDEATDIDATEEAPAPSESSE